MKGYALFLICPVVASKSIYLAFFFLASEAKTVPNKKAINVLE